MFVRLWMSADPVTLAPGAPIMDAKDLMEGMGFRRIPVVDEGKLVGILTVGILNRIPARDIAMPVERFMQVDPITVDPYQPLDEAVLLMKTHKIGGLPVVSKGKLVGILTESNVFDAVRRIMEADSKAASFVCFDMPDAPGCVPGIAQYTEGFGLTIRSFVTHRRGADTSRRIVAMRVEGSRVEEYIEELWKKGFRVLHVGGQAKDELQES
jgi:acetoin utilization protein AcuB